MANYKTIGKNIYAELDKLTSKDKEQIDFLVKTAGYELKIKKAKGNGLTKVKLIEDLKEINSSASKELIKRLEAKENYMKIVAEYKKIIKSLEETK